MDVAVLVQVHYGKCFRVHFKTCCRTTQDSPEFLVEFAQVRYVLAGADVDSCHSSEGGEMPFIVTIRPHRARFGRDVLEFLVHKPELFRQ